MNVETYYTLTDSPFGPLLLVGDGTNLTHLYFQAGERPLAVGAGWQKDDAPFSETIDQVRAYFAGKLQAFDFPLRPEGTPFQQQVWKQLQTIPYGETISYGRLAQRLGKPKAARAVGLANARNPISLVIPCHRVIGSNGHLTGYGAGLRIKEALLAHERHTRES